MSRFAAVGAAVLRKELVTEWRGKELLPTLTQFVVLSLLVANFAFSVTGDTVASVAPGVLWLGLVFCLLLTAGRVFGRERDQGSLEALLLTPASRAAILAGKAAAAALTLLLCEVVLVLGLGLFLGAQVASVALWGTLLAATVGLTIVGCVFAGLAVQTRARDVLLPVLLLPLCLPIVVAGGRAVQLAMSGSSVGFEPFGLLLDFDILFLVAALLAAGYVLDD